MMSGNVDAPEGGFDAVMQVIACKVSNAHLCPTVVTLTTNK